MIEFDDTKGSDEHADIKNEMSKIGEAILIFLSQNKFNMGTCALALASCVRAITNQMMEYDKDCAKVITDESIRIINGERDG